MKRPTLLLAILLCCSALVSSDTPKRPRILGIAYVKILVSDMDKARDFYSRALHSVPPPDSQKPCDWCERAPGSIGLVKKGLGPIELEPLPAMDSTNLLKEVAFKTDDVRKLREFFQKNHIAPDKFTKCAEDPCFSVRDPENHALTFVQPSDSPSMEIVGAYSSASSRSPIIHAGFVVHDRAAEDHFYKDILGFRLYWHGGFKDDGEDWYELQVPDGTDWIEYMLNIPADADRKELGIQNHFSLGVKDIRAAAEQLRKNGLEKFDGPEIGRDGKWALDAYDPDGTRVEIMEFTPAKEPCCHPYTAPHPKP